MLLSSVETRARTEPWAKGGLGAVRPLARGERERVRFARRHSRAIGPGRSGVVLNCSLFAFLKSAQNSSIGDFRSLTHAEPRLTDPPRWPGSGRSRPTQTRYGSNVGGRAGAALSQRTATEHHPPTGDSFSVRRRLLHVLCHDLILDTAMEPAPLVEVITSDFCASLDLAKFTHTNKVPATSWSRGRGDSRGTP
jgi:hypothetical protein